MQMDVPAYCGDENKSKLAPSSTQPIIESSSLIEFPQYELSTENSESSKTEFKSLEVRSQGEKLEVKNDSLSLSSEKSTSTQGESAPVKLQPSVSEEKSGPSSKQHNPKETTLLGREGILKIEKTTNIGAGVLDYYAIAKIPYDESLGKYIPQDKADEEILRLVPRLQKLQEELKRWKDLGAERIRQVTQRLKQVKLELDTLKKEKEEAEKFIKEKKILEEKAMKRIVETENAVANAKSELENAKSTACMLEVQNSLLKKELDALKLWSAKSTTSHQEALEREQVALSKIQSCKTQKCLLEDELEKERHKLASLQHEVDKERSLPPKIEAKAENLRAENLRAEKGMLLAQAESIRKERKQLEERAEIEEDVIGKKMAKDLKNYEKDIAKLEKELAQLKLESESTRIASLRGGFDRKKDGFSEINKARGKMAAGGLMRDRECVMCLENEISVVFLPCAHQILCAGCNELHEKLGMKDCPSCRTPILHRIHATYA